MDILSSIYQGDNGGIRNLSGPWANRINWNSHGFQGVKVVGQRLRSNVLLKLPYPKPGDELEDLMVLSLSVLCVNQTRTVCAHQVLVQALTFISCFSYFAYIFVEFTVEFMAPWWSYVGYFVYFIMRSVLCCTNLDILERERFSPGKLIKFIHRTPTRCKITFLKKNFFLLHYIEFYNIGVKPVSCIT